MRALVTGAKGAIGSAIADALAARGMQVTRVDREEWDLAKPDSLPSIDTDLLVNCAGIMDMHSIAGTQWARAMELLNVDLMSPLKLMHTVIPGMIARGYGGIINVTSMAGVTPLRGAAFYGAAKAGLAMASEVARLELREKNIRVVTVYPGPVHSALEKRARGHLAPNFLARMMPTGDPRELAELVAQAYDKDEARVVYPALYSAANRIPRVAGWITSRFSPSPLA